MQKSARLTSLSHSKWKPIRKGSDQLRSWVYDSHKQQGPSRRDSRSEGGTEGHTGSGLPDMWSEGSRSVGTHASTIQGSTEPQLGHRKGPRAQRAEDTPPRREGFGRGHPGQRLKPNKQGKSGARMLHSFLVLGGRDISNLQKEYRHFKIKNGKWKQNRPWEDIQREPHYKVTFLFNGMWEVDKCPLVCSIKPNEDDSSTYIGCAFGSKEDLDELVQFAYKFKSSKLFTYKGTFIREVGYRREKGNQDQEGEVLVENRN